MSGYVRLYRTLSGHSAFRNDAEAMAFAWMIMRASWKPALVRYKDREIGLERGQLAVSVRDFAAAMDRDKAWIERLLTRLKSKTMIETRHETGVNVITICNYCKYQANGDGRETPAETPREAGARQAQDTEQVSEEGKKRISEPEGSSPRIWICPADVDPQVWKDLLSNRKRKRHANTATAWKRFNDDLQRVSRETGIHAPQLIEQCAARGWCGIFDPRGDKEQPKPAEKSLADSIIDDAGYRRARELRDAEEARWSRE